MLGSRKCLLSNPVHHSLTGLLLTFSLSCPSCSCPFKVFSSLPYEVRHPTDKNIFALVREVDPISPPETGICKEGTMFIKLRTSLLTPALQPVIDLYYQCSPHTLPLTSRKENTTWVPGPLTTAPASFGTVQVCPISIIYVHIE